MGDDEAKKLFLFEFNTTAKCCKIKIIIHTNKNKSRELKFEFLNNDLRTIYNESPLLNLKLGLFITCEKMNLKKK